MYKDELILLQSEENISIAILEYFNEMILNKENYFFTDDYSIDEHYFKIVLSSERNRDTENDLFFAFLIYLTNETKIKSLDDKLTIEVLSPQIIYLLNELSNIIYFKHKNIKLFNNIFYN